MKGSFTVTAEAPKPLRVSGFSVRKAGRQIIVRVRVNKGVRAKIRLLRRARPVVSVGATLRSGANVKRVRIPARIKRGSYRVQVVVMDGGTRKTFSRTIRV
jgi:hypothetical protein